MKKQVLSVSIVLFVIAWWLVWRYATSQWYENRSFAYQVLTSAFVILWCGISVGAVVRLVRAFFSKRVRDSMMSHKLVHVMWFILAGAIAFCLLAPIIFVGKTKG